MKTFALIILESVIHGYTDATISNDPLLKKIKNLFNHYENTKDMFLTEKEIVKLTNFVKDDSCDDELVNYVLFSLLLMKDAFREDDKIREIEDLVKDVQTNILADKGLDTIEGTKKYYELFKEKVLET